jgi:F420-0:gamma-glutamyl ligase-like protein
LFDQQNNQPQPLGMIGSAIGQFSKATTHSTPCAMAAGVKAKRCRRSARPVNVESMSQENAYTEENTRRCDDLDHGFPPCLAMPGSAALRNWW